jgi:hypothetical protein
MAGLGPAIHEFFYRSEKNADAVRPKAGIRRTPSTGMTDKESRPAPLRAPAFSVRPGARQTQNG